MIVCSCRAVSASVIQASIENGATTVAEVANACTAGTRCGGCWPTIQRMIDAHHHVVHDDVPVRIARPLVA